VAVLETAELDAALEPESYLGAAGAFVDRALAEYGPGAHSGEQARRAS
jgi:hypothetical protein